MHAIRNSLRVCGGAMATLLLIGGCAAAPPSTAGACPHALSVARGEPVKVELRRDGGTGYSWFAVLPPDSPARQIAAGTEPASAGPPAGPRVRQWWVFDIGTQAQVQLDFYLYRPWEGRERSVEHCIVNVTAT